MGGRRFASSMGWLVSLSASAASTAVVVVVVAFGSPLCRVGPSLFRPSGAWLGSNYCMAEWKSITEVLDVSDGLLFWAGCSRSCRYNVHLFVRALLSTWLHSSSLWLGGA